jgi:hypothetical protein
VRLPFFLPGPLSTSLPASALLASQLPTLCMGDTQYRPLRNLILAHKLNFRQLKIGWLSCHGAGSAVCAGMSNDEPESRGFPLSTLSPLCET